MAEPSLEFIGRQLVSIQEDLRQLRFEADVDRRNTSSQYDNLVSAVGLKIGAFEGVVEHRIDAVEQRLVGIEQRLVGIDQHIEQRLGGIEQRLVGIDQHIEQRLGGIEQRLDNLNSLVADRLDRIMALIAKT